MTEQWLAAKLPELRSGGGCSAGALVGALRGAGMLKPDGMLKARSALGLRPLRVPAPARVQAAVQAVCLRCLRADAPTPPPRAQSDPRRSPWRAAARGAPGCGALPVGADASGLSEVLNVAWAVHEMVSDPVGGALDWLAAQQRGGGGAA